MAVWTKVSDLDLNSFLAAYDLGAVLTFNGITEGVENSNYYLKTEKGNFILTIYEKRVDKNDLPFFLGLMNHLAKSPLAVATAAPIAQKDGALYGDLAGKSAAVISFLSGRWKANPSSARCETFGKSLAQLHLAAQSFDKTRENKMGIKHWRALLSTCTGLEQSLTDFVLEEITALERLWQDLPDLPRGIIHGDCFPDNVLFDGDRVSIIDFYFACEDIRALDLAICLNAWCWQNEQWHKDKAAALLEGYRAEIPLSPAEETALPLLCRSMALRFFLTRLADKLASEKMPSAILVPKNPDEYKAILSFHQQGGAIL